MGHQLEQSRSHVPPSPPSGGLGKSRYDFLVPPENDSPALYGKTQLSQLVATANKDLVPSAAVSSQEGPRYGPPGCLFP